jgi:hypothetical protein
MTLLNLAVVVYQVVIRVTAVTVDASCAATMFFGSFPKDCRCCVRESSQMVAISAAIEVTQRADAGSWCCK